MSDSGEIAKSTLAGFVNDNVMRLSGSLAYSTIFSIGPFIILMVAVLGIFFGHDAIEGKVNGELSRFLGEVSAKQLENIIKNAATSGKSVAAITVGSLVLFLGATSIFSEIQNSINDIWGIKPKPKRNWLMLIQNRFLSFSVIVGFGFLLLVSLTVSAVIEDIGQKLQAFFPGIFSSALFVVNETVTFIITTFIFCVIYKVLPDALIKWRDVIAGAMLTAVLFMAGKSGISYYIARSNIASMFGATGSLIILVVWIYYSSLILYAGAEFTKAYALKRGAEIRPNEYSVTKKEVEIETGKASVQENENQDVVCRRVEKKP